MCLKNPRSEKEPRKKTKPQHRIQRTQLHFSHERCLDVFYEQSVEKIARAALL